MSTNKLRVITDFEKLSTELQEQVKLVYPEGYSQHLITFTNQKGELVSALRFETDDKIYMIRMSVQMARDLVDDDPDFDDLGNLMDDTKAEYAVKHSDVDYLSENENYDDDDDIPDTRDDDDDDDDDDED